MFRKRHARSFKGAALAGVVTYLLALFGPIAHADEFGAEPHDHHDEPCQVFELLDTFGASLTPAEVEIGVPAFPPVTYLITATRDEREQSYTPYASRAPPV